MRLQLTSGNSKLYADTEWQKNARCHRSRCSVNPDDFHDEKPNSHTRMMEPLPNVQAICDTCPVAVECLTYSYQLGDAYGVWGGLSRHQRQALQSQRSRIKCISCQSTRIARRFEDEICLGCGISWEIQRNEDLNESIHKV